MGGEVPTSRLTSLDVICGKEYMTVRAEFNSPFNGIVFSKGTYGQSKCVYVKPHSSLTHLTFNVRYDECGTKPDLQGKYFENTIVIQYGNDIIDVLDEAKRLRCEWQVGVGVSNYSYSYSNLYSGLKPTRSQLHLDLQYR